MKLNSISTRLFLLVFIVCVPCTFLNAQVIRFDTVQTKIVGPGTVYYKVLAPERPWSLDLVTVDLRNPFISIESVKSLDKLAAGREKTSVMSLRKNVAQHWSLAAINADFFNLSTGMPNNVQVAKGEVLKMVASPPPAVGFDSTNKFVMFTPQVSGRITIRDTIIGVTGVNEERGTASCILYNSYYAAFSPAQTAGLELVVRPIEGWMVNDTLRYIVDSMKQNRGSTALNTGRVALSFSGNYAAAVLLRVAPGDTIKINMRLANSPAYMKEVLGGHPFMLKNGSTVGALDPNDPFVTARHPRSAIGVNADSTKLFLVVVDGRQVSSLGMNLFELADFMSRIGVKEAMNFDGGGSSAMVVRNAVMNSPSDGTERTVSNALLVVSKAPLGTLSQIILSPKDAKVFAGKTQQYSVTGYDQYYNELAVPSSGTVYSLSKQSLGTITSGGLFRAGNVQDTGYVIVRNGSLKDSVRVIVKTLKFIQILPKRAVTDKFRIISFNANAYDSDSIIISVPVQQFTWQVSDSSIAGIDVFGQFTGYEEGSVKVYVTYGGKTDTSFVTIQVGRGMSVVDSLERLTGWNSFWQNTDTLLCSLRIDSSYFTSGNSSFKMIYSFVYDSGKYYYGYAKKDFLLYGVPDSAFIDIRSDGKPHRVFIDLTDAVGAVYRINTNKVANRAGVFETLKGIFPATSNVYYPVTVKAIVIAFGSTLVPGQTYSGAVHIDNFRILYPTNPTKVRGGRNKKELEGFQLFQNYPNPFNPETQIEYYVPLRSTVSLSLYSVTGERVAELFSGELDEGSYVLPLDARKHKLSSGVYFYTLLCGDYTITRKLMLLQ